MKGHGITVVILKCNKSVFLMTLLCTIPRVEGRVVMECMFQFLGRSIDAVLLCSPAFLFSTVRSVGP